jgi:hypothetical protein
MQIGLLWYDDDPRKTLDAKIAQATRRYREKYGRVPNACVVNPAVATGGHCGGLRLIPTRTIRPNYLWIGVEDASGDSAVAED